MFLIKYILIVIVLLGFACKEEFLLDINTNETHLVVDGVITNEADPYTVKLSLSSQVNLNNTIPLSGYSVKIIDDLGNAESLKETSPDVYNTDMNGLQGKIGLSYKLLNKSHTGTEYETYFQKIPQIIEIDSLYASYENKELVDDSYELSGYQFFIDTKESETQRKLHFVDNNSRRLNIRYSTLVRQYMINEEAYLFWNNIENQISLDNVLYASQPYNVEGNVYNKNNPNEKIFGYFTVGSVQQKRIFVDRSIVTTSYEVYCIKQILQA
ncbi:MAG: DUF4249 domain-containing protein [Bacteroidales bacterium]|nr:DUF4249 domain-containing protein [Bacteroidales bacterium]